LGTAFLLTRLGTEYPGVLGGDFGPRTYAGGLLFAIDPAFAIPGGYARLQGTMQDYTFTQTMVPVPEPEAWALLSLGLAALAWRRRRAA
ncbi:MAG: PEP-CTERM sorting domain-containing protein, partial [Burkholderiales bacterium]|nr:PEP-CTERM sorting domain-containing protein [Burkholderiales bacterium]